MTGTQLIERERARQLSEEGWDTAHDDQHTHDELARAAATYALPVEMRTKGIWNTKLWRLVWPPTWTFKGSVYLQSTTHPRAHRIRELTKAGALIAAEIDRLQRIGGASE